MKQESKIMMGEASTFSKAGELADRLQCHVSALGFIMNAQKDYGLASVLADLQASIEESVILAETIMQNSPPDDF